MSTWINGASVNRMTNKELPPVDPARIVPEQPSTSVQDTIKRAVQAERETKERRGATGFLDRFFRLFADYSHHTGRQHKRKLGAVSTRSAKEICAEVTAFFAARPRPWRYFGNRQKPTHAVRYRYRKLNQPS